MDKERPETEAVWRKLRQAWTESHLAERRLQTLLGFVKEIEWANRRATGEDARKLVSEALRGYHGQFFRDQETGDWTWETLYRWLDQLELSALSEHLTALDTHLHQDKEDDSMARAENALREWFTECGYVVSCVEQITKATLYTTTRCVVAVKRPGQKPVEIARTNEWPEAIEKSKAWLLEHSTQPERPEALFDTDLPEGVMATSEVESSTDSPEE